MVQGQWLQTWTGTAQWLETWGTAANTWRGAAQYYFAQQM